MLLKESIVSFQKNMSSVNRSHETIRSYNSELKRWVRFIESKHNGPVYLDEVTTQHLEDYILYMMARGNAPASRSRWVYIIKSFYNFCYKKDLVERNLGVKLDPVAVPQKERAYLTWDEVEQLITAIRHPLIQLVIMTLAYTGLRISEALNLTVADLDLTAGTILVRNTKGKRDRRIPIHPRLLSRLKEYKEKGRVGLQTELFFGTKKTGRLSRVYVNRKIKEAISELGWSKTNISCHSLRHSFATCLIKQKQSIVMVQKLLGHAKLTTTGIYTHADLQDLVDAVNIL